jgi:hypothetical protein
MFSVFQHYKHNNSSVGDKDSYFTGTKCSFSSKFRTILLKRKYEENQKIDKDNTSIHTTTSSSSSINATLDNNKTRNYFLDFPILASYLYRNTNISNSSKENPFKGQEADIQTLVNKTKKRKLKELYKPTSSSSGMESLSSKTSYGGTGENINQALTDSMLMTEGSSATGPVQLLEDIFLALSIISTEYQSFEDDQVDMIMRIVLACVPNIFKESSLEYMDYLHKVFKISSMQKVKKDLLLIARRRGGKTTITCAVIACILVVLLDQRILFFSTGERISTMGRDKIIEFLQVLKNSRQSSKFSGIQYQTSEESLKVLGIHGLWNFAKFYPANVTV